jgi:hypothetical protein
MPQRDPIKIRESNKKYYYKNKDKIKEYRVKNKERRGESFKKWNELNKDKRKEYVIKWKTDNKEQVKRYNINYHCNRRKTDALFGFQHRIRSLIRVSFKKNGYSKKSKTQVILGTDYKSFKEYLEGLWEPWMSWDNYGLYKKDTFNYGWDIDHIIPSSSAKTEEELIKLNHYTNLKPLCSKVNRHVKKDKLQPTL